MALSEIVNVTIQAGTVSPARVGFGVPLLLFYHSVWSGTEVRTYTTFSGVAADFASTSMVYKCAQALFAQSPRPSKIKVGRLPAPASANSQVLDFTDMASSTAIQGSVTTPDGTAHTINIPWNTNLSTTLGDLKTFLDPLTGIGTCTVASPLVTVPATNNGEMNHFSFTTVGAHVRDTTSDWGYATALDAAVLIDPDFYGVIVDCNSPKNMDKVARWALSNDRLALFAPQYTKPSQFASGEFTSGSDFTALQANDSAVGLITKQTRLSFLEAAWAGKMFPQDPGSATWAFKSLEGVGGDAWTATERTTIETAHGNHYAEEAEVGITRPGKSFGGEWIDVVIGLAWLEARLQERLFALLVNNPKIPYTDAGLGMLVAEVRAQLREAEARSIVASGWTVSITAVADQDSADRADRIVRGLEFQAQLAGAVHEIDIVGTVTA